MTLPTSAIRPNFPIEPCVVGESPKRYAKMTKAYSRGYLCVEKEVKHNLLGAATVNGAVLEWTKVPSAFWSVLSTHIGMQGRGEMSRQVLLASRCLIPVLQLLLRPLSLMGCRGCGSLNLNRLYRPAPAPVLYVRRMVGLHAGRDLWVITEFADQSRQAVQASSEM